MKKKTSRRVVPLIVLASLGLFGTGCGLLTPVAPAPQPEPDPVNFWDGFGDNSDGLFGGFNESNTDGGLFGGFGDGLFGGLFG